MNNVDLVDTENEMTYQAKLLNYFKTHIAKRLPASKGGKEGKDMKITANQ